MPTDFGVHDFWLQPGTDAYCVAHPAIQGVPQSSTARVLATGVPLMPGFARPPRAGEAKVALGLDPARPVVLVLGGGLGLGVDAVAEQLLAARLDANLVLADASIGVDEFNAVVREGAKAHKGVVEITDDPIVSSDVLGSTLSLLFDTQATEKAGKHIIKALGWYENLGHAARLLDVLRLYHQLDAAGGA